MNEVFAVFDASGLLTGIITIVVGLIGVLIPLVAFRFVMKSLRTSIHEARRSDDWQDGLNADGIFSRVDDYKGDTYHVYSPSTGFVFKHMRHED